MSNSVFFTTDKFMQNMSDWANGSLKLEYAASTKALWKKWSGLLQQVQRIGKGTYVTKSGATIDHEEIIKMAEAEYSAEGYGHLLKLAEDAKDEGDLLMGRVRSCIPEDMVAAREKYRMTGDLKVSGKVKVGKKVMDTRSLQACWESALNLLGADKVDPKTTAKWLKKVVGHQTGSRIRRKNASFARGGENLRQAQDNTIDLLVNFLTQGYESVSADGKKTLVGGGYDFIPEDDHLVFVSKKSDAFKAWQESLKKA